jgi:hypothetical protein
MTESNVFKQKNNLGGNIQKRQMDHFILDQQNNYKVHQAMLLGLKLNMLNIYV